MYAATKRKLSVADFYLMGETGVFHRDERVELLDGELYEMAPIGDDHIGTVIGFTYLVHRRIGERALISVQNPVRLSDFSEPEPDLVLLRPRPDFYRSGKPRPEDVLLLVEVARSSLEYDRHTKLPRYAAAGIPEVWIVNLMDGVIEVYRAPVGDAYTEQRTYQRGETVFPAAFPDAGFTVAEITG